MAAYWVTRAGKVILGSVEGLQVPVYGIASIQGSWKSWEVLERAGHMKWLWTGSSDDL